MKKLIAVLPILTCACASLPAPDPVIPARVDAAEAAQLYRAYKLVCEKNECQQGEHKYDVRAFERTQFDAPRRLLSSSRHARNAVSWVLFGTSIGTALGSGLSFLSVQASGDEAWRTRGIAFATTSAASLLIGLLVRAAWPRPTETFETAYNQALDVELKKRVAGDPTAMQPRRELSAAEKECIRRRSSSMFVFDRFKIGRCISKR